MRSNSNAARTNRRYPTASGPVISFTELTSELYYSDGSLGTLKIPSIGLTVKIYEGTDTAALRKGAGHFTGTTAWDGNYCLAAHNRGVNEHFGKIHTLKNGDTIHLTTPMGTRNYVVTSVTKVSVNDTSGLDASSTNNAHYEQEVNQPAQTTPAPSAVTEENVRATIQALRNTYPTGTVYGEFYRSTSSGPYGAAPSNCAGWATLCSDTAFGTLPWKRVTNPSWDQIRPGDLVEYDNVHGGHVVVVLDKTDEYIKVTESGTNNKTRWGGQYFKWWLEQQTGYTLYTRYTQ